MLAANRTPLPQACGARRTPCAEVSAAIRRISVMPPARATSGCAISSARRSSRSWKSNRVNSRSPEAIEIVVDQQFDVGAKTAASRLHPAHTVGDREAVTTHHTHLGSGEALRGVVREFHFGLVARRPPAARIAPYRAARCAKRLVERNPERLRLDVPYCDVNAGNCFHDDTAASAFISLGDATRERRPAARAVIHLFVDPLREHGILIDAFRRELMLDDGCDDRRRAESRADAGEAVVCFDADERRITLDLGSKVGAVTLFLRNGCRHRNRGHFDDFHGSLFPGQSIPSRFWMAFAVNRRMS